MLIFFAALTFLATFTTAAIAVVLAYTLLLRMKAPAGAEEASPLLGGDLESGLLKDEALSTISFVDHLLAKFNVVARLKKLLEEADLDWSVGRIVMLLLLLGAVTLAVTMQLTWIPGWAALILSAGAAALPVLFVSRLRSRRLSQFEEQFPDALDSLCSAMRAGHPLAAGLLTVANEYGNPLGGEMRRVFEERKLGMPMEQALDNLAERIPLMDVGLFVAAVQLQTRTGGNLAEALGRVSETMREANALRGEVKSIAAHGKLTGLVLTLLPIGVVTMMNLVNPGFFTPLLQHPLGKTLIFGAIFALIAAHLVISWIVDIEI